MLSESDRDGCHTGESAGSRFDLDQRLGHTGNQTTYVFPAASDWQALLAQLPEAT